MYIYNRSVSIIEYKMEQTYIHMYMCMRLKTIMKPCLYIYILMCIFSCSICLFENLADGKFQNLGNWIFSFDILMPLYYCVVAMINKFNKYIYI